MVKLEPCRSTNHRAPQESNAKRSNEYFDKSENVRGEISNHLLKKITNKS